jgi:hypothetical protein
VGFCQFAPGILPHYAVGQQTAVLLEIQDGLTGAPTEVSIHPIFAQVIAKPPQARLDVEHFFSSILEF